MDPRSVSMAAHRKQSSNTCPSVAKLPQREHGWLASVRPEIESVCKLLANFQKSSPKNEPASEFER
ncbi:hypothetical protein Q31a_08790 [Aureliella helgolandensis]|uniref:Uncharacterized protein n=1 Tax=Aureliella helgolandensis TaxID=2527968 RepID=A0A518G1W5_9BACT|nr:hypothetical protein Q31a_08790 [Aureliella helgolandensis]